MDTIKYWSVILIMFFILYCCDRNTAPATDPDVYRAEIETWHSKRIANLKAPNGWLNLAGLYWLMEGTNTFGSDSSNNIVFPAKAPAFIGVLELKGDSACLGSTRVPVMIDSLPVQNKKLKDDSSENPDVMTLNSLAWFIIKRGDRFGIRLRDYSNPMIDSLHEIPSFDTDDRWRVAAVFTPYQTPEKYIVQTVIGTGEENLVPGELTFRIGRKKLTLYPFKSEDGFFIVFGDKTNGNETYPAGRFLYTAAPDDHNQVIIDFNKAYNPPCAFTPYATCPLPLRKNILPVAIEAGEKVVHLFSKNHN